MKGDAVETGEAMSYPWLIGLVAKSTGVVCERESPFATLGHIREMFHSALDEKEMQLYRDDGAQPAGWRNFDISKDAWYDSYDYESAESADSDPVKAYIGKIDCEEQRVFWMRHMLEHASPSVHAVFPNIRHQSEAEEIRRMGGVLVEVRCDMTPPLPGGETAPCNEARAIAVEDIVCDFSIPNHGDTREAADRIGEIIPGVLRHFYEPGRAAPSAVVRAL